jgi:molybdenum cofactor cytidylyltransferase
VKVAGLILAAGESRRMGRPKALLRFRGTTFIQNLVGLFSACCDPVIVVLGHNPEPIRRTLGDSAQIVIHSGYLLGQFSSMQAGLRVLPHDVDGVLFTLVDHPDPAPETLTVLMSDEAPISIPSYYGRKGHPVFFRRDVISEFLMLEPEEQANTIARRHAMETRLVPVDDPAILDDIDDPVALRLFRERIAREVSERSSE